MSDPHTEELEALIEQLVRTRLAKEQPRMPDDERYREPVNPDGPAAVDALVSLRSQLSEKQAEIARMKEDREYIIGFNAGWEAHEEQVDGPPQTHKFWAPGEPDCPPEIKAGNGELHTLRCKVCGINSPRDDRCRTSLSKEGGRG